MGRPYGRSYHASRELRMAFAGGRCEVCKHDGSVYRVEAHHAGGETSYERDRRGRMTLHDLVILCVRCHDLVTDRDRRDRYAAVEIRLVELPSEEQRAPQPSAHPPLAVVRIPLNTYQKPILRGEEAWPTRP